MTLAEEQQPAPSQQSSDDAQHREGRSGRRRRRGKRPSDAPGREDGQQGRTERPERTPRQAEAPGTRDGVESRAEAPAPAGGASPSGGSPDAQQGEAGGRNRRRNRGRGRGEGREGQAPQGTAQTSTQPQSPSQPQSQDRPRQPRPGQPQRADQPRPGQPQRADQPRGEKKERPPRGSVLNRRQTRGDFNDAPKQKEEAPQYVPVSAATVEQYVNGHRGWQKEVLTTLRGIVRSVAPDAEESIMWSQPVFSANGPVCFFKAYKDYIIFGFWRGTELSDTDGLLSGDLTMMRSMTLRSAKDVNREAFEALVKQAVRLNREKGDPTLS
ncbi:MAG: hypothetical protein FGM33_06595 [Candidatus Kapabacteria bacterium]|nr:hypothetical protein [Candidatus Kapabacteria bacterium]